MLYSEGERVLCFYGPLIYEAKCLKHRIGENGNCEYWVHYAGWNKKWDQWVPEEKLLKYNDENLEMKDEVKNIQLQNSNRGGRRAQKRRGEDSDQDSESRPPENESRESVVSSPASVCSSPASVGSSDGDSVVDIGALMEIPDELRPWLAGHQINALNAINYPAVVNIDAFLDMFKNNKKGNVTRIEIWVYEKIKELFNEACNWFTGAELDHYIETKAEHPTLRRASQIYGVNYLLIFFARLPEILLIKDMVDDKKLQMYTTIQEMLVYLTTIRNICISAEILEKMIPTWHSLLMWIARNLTVFFKPHVKALQTTD